MKRGYITYRYPGRKTVLKKHGKLRAVPPKVSLCFEDREMFGNGSPNLSLYECQKCHVMTPENELLLCDYIVDGNDNETCDCMYCFPCSNITRDTIPEDDWYCDVHK